MSENTRPYTIEVNDRGRLLYPLEFHGWPTLTENPAAAKCYERIGAMNLVRRLRTEMPGWAEHINAVPHPAYESFPDKPEQASCP